ncbi:unnamed protein product [Porites lobata]|uniref:Uncharacterized protein n=1 Tax=Porites lobata TaxID=104759 RepID=A0ABN8QM98_9CNID|nr:unnamed protein product [Porites lobata]
MILYITLMLTSRCMLTIIRSISNISNRQRNQGTVHTKLEERGLRYCGIGLFSCGASSATDWYENNLLFRRHSVRYLGPILWSKLDKNDKTCKSLSDFRNRMRNKDLTSLIADGCKGCLLCDS